MDLSPHRAPIANFALPILALNVLFVAGLPGDKTPKLFLAGMPAALLEAEKTLGIALLALSFALPFRSNRTGWMLFTVGTLAWMAAWGWQIIAPDSMGARSAIGFTAPAWTAGIWIAGLGFLARPPVFSPHRAWLQTWWGLAIGFFATHVAHAALVWTRL